ncbi:hypothetical protein CEP51_000674 [Fusarium floridanum]|uniref:Uncharacterized protein n=1 Tax=Fusarium floridanum TaxID=1325733 RepID=A0A428SL79_9HYPO|nr:hypothetical protein CEP51_000674 [Fusarium floridanum]
MNDFQNSKRSSDIQGHPLTKKVKTEEETQASSLSFQGSASAFGDPPGLSITDFENADVLHRIENALVESSLADEMTIDEDDEQAFDESGLTDPTTFSDDSQEILLYLAVSRDQANSWSEILLSLCIDLPMWDYLEPLKDFISQCKCRPCWRPTSLNPIGDFSYLNSGWASHDLDIDAKWEDLAQRIVELSGSKIDIRTLVKPSGPLKAVLTAQWHFPTWVTQHPLHGMTMDNSNPSMRAQHAKFKFDAHETIYDNWSQIKEECLKFTRWLNRHSKIILIIGDENYREWREFIHLDETVEAIKIDLDIDLPVFSDKPCFQIVRSKASKEIQQLVLFSYHSQYFFYRDISMRIRAYHDLLWNAVSEWAGIRPAKPCFFLRQSDVKQNAGNNPKKQAGDKYGFTQLNLARKLRHQEKRTGTIFPEFVVRRAFRKTINKNPCWAMRADVATGSFIVGIMLMWSQKAGVTLDTREYRMSDAGKRHYSVAIETLAKNRDVNIRKATEVRQSEEWKNSEAGKKQKKILNRVKDLPKNKNIEKKASLLRVKQVIELLGADPNNLTPTQLAIRTKLLEWDQMSNVQQRSLFNAYVIWWAPWCPLGLRYEGDGCPNQDDFDYAGSYHPCVNMERRYRRGEKEQFYDFEDKEPEEAPEEERS